MKNRMLFLLAMLFFNYVGAQNITNVAFQRQDKEVTVTYDLSKDANIRVGVSIDGGRYYGDYIQQMVGENVRMRKELEIHTLESICFG